MPNGGTYEGGWLAGKQDGKGVQAMPDGSRYDGEWKEGQPNGHGEMRNASGETLTVNGRRARSWAPGTEMIGTRCAICRRGPTSSCLRKGDDDEHPDT
jgi:hypothetical protein